MEERGQLPVHVLCPLLHLRLLLSLTLLPLWNRLLRLLHQTFKNAAISWLLRPLQGEQGRSIQQKPRCVLVQAAGHEKTQISAEHLKVQQY